MHLHKMTHTIGNIRLTITGLGLSLLLMLAQDLQAEEELVWQDSFDYVAIVPADSSGTTQNHHPLSLSPDDVHTLLSGIRVVPTRAKFDILKHLSRSSVQENDGPAVGNGKDAQAVFARNELQRIAPPISKALAKTKKGQDIVFSVSGRHKKSIGSGVLTTTARLFHTDGHLNLIFGEMHVDIEKRYRRHGGPSDVPEVVDEKKLRQFRLRTGSRKKESQLSFRILTDHTHVLQHKDGRTRNDWLAVDVANVLARQQVDEKAKKRRDEMINEVDELQHKAQQRDKDYEELERKVQSLEREIEETAPARQRAYQPQGLEERLMQLKELHKKGLVSDDIYEEKVRKLLEEL